MVLEQIYPIKLIEKKVIFAFILGLAYSVIGIGLAVIIFPEDPALVAVAFTSLLILPTLKKILEEPHLAEEKIKNDPSLIQKTLNHITIFSLMNFLRHYWEVIKVYAALFLGIFMSFSFFALKLPSLATNHIFENQINVIYGASVGKAAFSAPLFQNIFNNNLVVLTLCFLAAFILGEGAIFLITWNASVWGTIFGNLAKSASFAVGKNPYIYFLIIIIVVFPHMILEAISYFTAALGGTLLSKNFLKYWLRTKSSMIFVKNYLSFKNIKVLKNIIIIFLIAVAILVIAVLIETYVLGNVSVYRTIIRQSFLVR